MIGKKSSVPSSNYNHNNANKKPPQSQSRNVNGREKQRLNSANKERSPNQSSTNWFKQKDQQLLGMVKEYLQKNGFNRTFDVMKNQRPNRRITAGGSMNNKQEQQNKSNSIMQTFDKGERQEFFKLTHKLFQHPTDPGLKKLEFELEIYFCIYTIHPSVRKASSISTKAKDSFRKYIQTKGAQITNNNEELLAFYALPYIPKPQQQPSLAYAFTKEWLLKIRNKVVDQTSHLATQNRNIHSSSGYSSHRKVSALQEMYYNSIQNSKQKEQGCKENCKHLLEAQQMKNHNKQLLGFIQNLQIQYKDFTESSKSSLIQSNVKWFQFSRELLILAKKASKGQKVLHLQKYDAFLSKSVDELIYGTNDVSLFEKNSYFTEDVSINPQDNKNVFQKKIEGQLVCQIDLHRVVQFLGEATKADRQVQICLVLKALKDRFMRLKSPYARRQIIISYERHDICGIKENNYLQKLLLFQSSQKVKEFYLRLLNYITTDFCGISYLSGSERLIQNIVGIFGTEHEFSISRKYVLGILQRFSLLRKPQNLMISFGLIPMILKIFRNQKEQLSEYSRQYLTAMIMNLSLRRSSKTHFEKSKGQLVSILLSLVDSEDPSVKDYINGALYSLIQASALIKQEAIRQNAVDKFNTLLEEAKYNEKNESKQLQEDNNMDRNTLIRQYQYILEAFTGENQLADQSSISDDQEEEEGELDDIDEYDQDEIVSVSSDSEQYLEGEDKYLSGQELLLKQFALVGPEAIREQLLTRSVLDQTSKKIHNMTASINKSRRIDNIFSQQRPITPSLLPQL